MTFSALKQNRPRVRATRPGYLDVKIYASHHCTTRLLLKNKIRKYTYYNMPIHKI